MVATFEVLECLMAKNPFKPINFGLKWAGFPKGSWKKETRGLVVFGLWLTPLRGVLNFRYSRI